MDFCWAFVPFVKNGMAILKDLMGDCIFFVVKTPNTDLF